MTARTHAWLYALLLLAACGSPIVGAECRTGWFECDGVCVDRQNDPDNCGVCGHSCGPLECSVGSCGPHHRRDAGAGLEDGGLADASASDGGMDAGTGPGKGKGKGGVGSPFLSDSGLPGCAIGETECGTECPNLQITRMHCGECGIQCGAEQYCIDGMCKDRCELPLHLCMDTCVDYENDENNCGSCGHVCASGICMNATCADVIPGSLVVIGHDYSAGARATPPAMKTIAANAVFLAAGAPLRVLVYRGSAKAAAYDGVINALNASGKSWKKVDVEAQHVVSELHDAGTFVILPQDGSSDAELQTLAQSWGLALSQFLYRGGVVVLFEAATGANTGTYHALDAAGVFAAASREAIPRQTLKVKTPGIDIAANAPSMYRSSGSSVHFLDVQTDALVVVEDGQAQPVVLHQVISP